MPNPAGLQRHTAALFLFVSVFTPVSVGEVTFAQTEQATPQSERAAQIMVEQAKALIETHQYDAAAAALKTFLASYPTSRYVDDADLLLATAQIRNKRAPE